MREKEENRERRDARFELSPANGFMDSSAASRGKVRFLRLLFSLPLSFSLSVLPSLSRERQSHFFLPHPVRSSERARSFLTGSSDAAQMRPQLPLFRRSLSELAAPSKSYHTLSGISINAAALIARSSPYYRRAALRPSVLTQLLRNLSLAAHSLSILRLPLFAHPS